MKIRMPIALVLMNAMLSAVADEEMSNAPVVRSSESGRLYARSVPAEDYGQKGTTQVFRVGVDQDVMESGYDWYANEIYLGGTGEASIIRFGPWQRGKQPATNHLAIGIYRDGKIVREYSTLELQEAGSGLSKSVSHYRVLSRRLGFRWLPKTPTRGSFVYEVEGVSGKVFTFDLDTGLIVAPSSTTVPTGAVTNAIGVPDRQAPAALDKAETVALDKLARAIATAFIKNDETAFAATILPPGRLSEVLSEGFRKQAPVDVHRLVVDNNTERFRSKRTHRQDWEGLTFQSVEPGHRVTDAATYAQPRQVLKNSTVVLKAAGREPVRFKVENVVFVAGECYLLKLD